MASSTGIKFIVPPGDAMTLTVLLANGELVTCLYDEQSELSMPRSPAWGTLG